LGPPKKGKFPQIEEARVIELNNSNLSATIDDVKILRYLGKYNYCYVLVFEDEFTKYDFPPLPEVFEDIVFQYDTNRILVWRQLNPGEIHYNIKKIHLVDYNYEYKTPLSQNLEAVLVDDLEEYTRLQQQEPALLDFELEIDNNYFIDRSLIIFTIRDLNWKAYDVDNPPLAQYPSVVKNLEIIGICLT